MPLTNFPQEVVEFAVQTYKKPQDAEELRRSHVPFSGSPQKHPFDRSKIILVPDPYSSSTFYYEFKTADIVFVEELPNIVNMDGDVITMVRIWIKKMSAAVRCTPFVVAETR